LVVVAKKLGPTLRALELGDVFLRVTRLMYDGKVVRTHDHNLAVKLLGRRWDRCAETHCKALALRIVRQRSRHHLKLSTSDLTPVKERPNTQHAVVTSRRELRQRWMRIKCPKLTAKVAAKVATTERAACVEAPSLCRVELPDLGATRADRDTAAVAVPVYRTNVGVERPQ
jgi:hypothetical protein